LVIEFFGTKPADKEAAKLNRINRFSKGHCGQVSKIGYTLANNHSQIWILYYLDCNFLIIAKSKFIFVRLKYHKK